ncbi:c-type cytochrome [Burkholderia dolosa]|uniref:c-type cytochrome n=1 Tax=Burkholderia dolosa TaxID=152500 RepID=UPI003D15FD30
MRFPQMKQLKSRIVRRAAAAAAVGALAASAIGVAHADVGDGLKVARSNACMGCHAVDRKLVGPSFKDIAARYKSDPQAVAKLSKKVKEGGSGVWGAIPMPAHPRMSDADVRAVVEWVLAGAPPK